MYTKATTTTKKINKRKKGKTKNPSEHKIITKHTRFCFTVRLFHFHQIWWTFVHQAWNVHIVWCAFEYERRLLSGGNNFDAWEKRHVCVSLSVCVWNVYVHRRNVPQHMWLARSGHDLFWFYSKDQLNENYRHHRLKRLREMKLHVVRVNLGNLKTIYSLGSLHMSHFSLKIDFVIFSVRILENMSICIMLFDLCHFKLSTWCKWASSI